MDEHHAVTVRHRRPLSLQRSPSRRFRRQAAIPGALASAAMALLFVYPVVRVVVRGFRWSTVSELATNSRMWRIAWFSAWQAGVSTISVLALAVPMAGLLAGRSFPGRRWMLAVVAAPFTLPTVVVAAAIRETLPERFASGVAAIVSAHVFYNLGVATLVLLPRYELIDETLSQAAATLGASPRRVASTVILPLLAPAIRSAAVLTFTLCFTSFGVVLILGGPRRATLDVEIYQQALLRGRLDRASVLALFQFAVLGVLALLAGRTRGARLSSRPARRPVTRRPGDRPLGRTAFHAVVIMFVTAPLLALLRRSMTEPAGSFGFANFRALARTTRGSGLVHSPLSSFGTSARSAVIAAFLAMVIATGLVVAAQEVVRLRATFRLFGSLPLATSSVQLGLGFLVAFATAPVAWRSRWFAVPLVQAVVAVPFVVRQVSPVLEAVPGNLRNAAMTLGARPWTAWRTIDLRIARPAFASGAAIALAVSLGEFGAATFLARPDGPTVPVAIARLSGHPGPVVQGQAAALSMLLAVATLAVVIVGRTLGTPPERSLP